MTIVECRMSNVEVRYFIHFNKDSTKRFNPKVAKITY